MKKVHATKPCKFLIICGEKVYKFSCNTDDLKESWIKALNNEMKITRGDVTKKIENFMEVRLKKKIIVDFYNLPNIGSDKLYMKKQVIEEIKNENFFLERAKV